jgi:lipooligosaccharide transport system permease protein
MASALSVLETDLAAYKRVWRGSVLSSFVLPILFVLGFGVGVGRFVDLGGRLGPVHYLDYIVPGMLASTAMQVAFGESAWPVLSKFQWVRVYHAWVASPLRVVDIVGGELLFVLFRVVASGTVFLAVTAAFGAVHSWWALAVVPVVGLVGVAISAPVLAFSGQVEQDGFFPLLMRFVVIPMSLFAEVFFPIAKLPGGLRLLAYVSPLWHAVVVCRAATLPGFGMPWWAVLGHLAYLVLWAAVGFGLALVTFRRRLAT